MVPGYPENGTERSSKIDQELDNHMKKEKREAESWMKRPDWRNNSTAKISS